jgi:hypothetical protein
VSRGGLPHNHSAVRCPTHPLRNGNSIRYLTPKGGGMGRAAPGQKSGEEGRPWPQSSLNFFLLWVSPDPEFHVMRIRILLLKIILSSR